MTTPDQNGPSQRRSDRSDVFAEDGDQLSPEVKLFAELLALPTPGQRATYLEKATSNDSKLRRDMEELLDAHENAGSFLVLPPGASSAATVLRPGSRIAHYEILSELGAGGMGQVYLARDQNLERKTALKLVVPELSRIPQLRQRFLLEARAAAALNHPNICTIYDVGVAEDHRLFIAMEYVDGLPLSEHAKPLHLGELLDTILQIVTALEAAHAKGIVHHDVKPANIRCNKQGIVKVLDFGLAKRLSEKLDRAPGAHQGRLPEDQSSVTTVLAGTPEYMSPEQVRGQQVDQRTDIFSLGVLLYELITNHQPFHAESLPETVNMILHSEPEPPGEFNAEAKGELERIIVKCLRKDPGQRYQSMRELRHELEELRLDQGSSCPANSVAVVPFVNRGSDPKDEFFSDGLTEDLVTALSRIPGLQVTAHSSSMALKGRTEDAREAGRQLHVARVLEGSVRRAPGGLRITVRLVDTRDGYVLWSGTYNRKTEDVFWVQDDITSIVVGQLQLKLLGALPAKPPGRYTDNIEAYTLYLKGRHYWNKRTDTDLAKAVEYFRRVLEIDANYALAYSGISDAYFYRGYAFGNLLPGEAMPKAKQAALRALEIDNDLPEAHTSLALILSGYEWEHAAAEKHFRRAISLNANYASAYHFYGAFLWVVFQCFDEAIAAAKRALTLDPLSVPVNNICMMLYFQAGRFDAAIRQAKELCELDPNQPRAAQVLSTAFQVLGREEDAFQFGMRARELTDTGEAVLTSLRHAYRCEGIEGFRAMEDSVDLQIVHRATPQDHQQRYWLACTCARIGLNDQALDLLERTCEDRSALMVWLKVQPEFQSLHDDPRFRRLVETVRLGAPRELRPSNSEP